MLATAMSGFTPVQVVRETVAATPSDPAEPLAIAGPAVAAEPSPGVLELDLPCGTRIRANPGADAELLRVALAALTRR